MKWLRRLLLLLLFAVFMLWRAPANVAAAALARQCGGACALVEAHGGLWRGGGRLMWRDDVGVWRHAATLAWRLDWSWRTPQRLDALFDVNGAALTVTAAPDGVRFKTQRMPLSVTLFAALLPSALPRQGWFGDLHIDAALRCDWLGVCAGDADADWRNAGMTVISPQALGDYSINLELANGGETAALKWSSRRGPLWIEAAGDVRGEQLRASGEVWAEGPQRERLENFLRPLAAHDAASGRYRLRYPLPQQ